jgi:hypothetical protein
MRPDMGDALVQQPGVQFLIVLDPQAGREEPLAHQPDLVWPLIRFAAQPQPDAGVQATGSTR